MIVYRIETLDGYGPYSHEKINFPPELQDIESNPLPMNDGISLYTSRKYFAGDWYFGFHTVDLLFRWFGPYWDFLVSKNLKCSIYNIHHARVKKGNTQCAFVKDLAVLVDSISAKKIKENIQANKDIFSKD